MKKDIYVLGINDGHNAGAAIVKNGSVLAAVQEERLVNIKNYSGVPANAIRKVFEIAAIPPEEINLIAIVSLVRAYAPVKELPFKVRAFYKISPYIHNDWFIKMLIKHLHKHRDIKGLKTIFKQLKIETEIMFIEHHLAHAAAAYYQCPWEKAVVLTADGTGDGLSATVNIGEKCKISRISATSHYDSIGNFYSEITAYLGMKRWEHEYKVMGLAPYGNAEHVLKKINGLFRLNPNNKLQFENKFGACCIYMQKKLQKLFASERFDNIAAACQSKFESIMQEWVRNAVSFTGIHKVACAGGNFLNVKANKLLRELEEVDEIFFYPAADDSGTPVGAALEGYYRYCEKEGIQSERLQLQDLYYGMEYSNDYIEKVLKTADFFKKASYFAEIESVIAEKVAVGKIVARFEGRCEFGPRALGNRSILADARDLKNIRKLNTQIKLRDFWMPFAPSLLEERTADYILNPKPAPYMIEAFDTTPNATEIIAALHQADFTTRPQTVDNLCKKYKKLLDEFERLTGVGGLINTSFNLHGYPIVGTPELAVWTFKNSSLDYLAIGNWLVER